MPEPIRPIHGKMNNYERVMERLFDILNGSVDKGGFSQANTVNQPGNTDNIHVQVVTPNVANTEFAVTHNLNRIPTGINVVFKSASSDTYASTTTWNTSQIFLKCTQANVTLTMEIY